MIISEALLFMVGIAITSFVIYVFGNISSTVEGISAKDQLQAVGNEIADAIIKSSKNVNTTIRLEIPKRLSNSPYAIDITDTVNVFTDKFMARSELFNITKRYDITVQNGKISSAVQFINVSSTNNKITLKSY